MFKLYYTASPKPKWWCKGQRVVRSALKTVHSGQFDKHPPPPKKNIYIYIYIYLATSPCLITAAQFHHELTPSYSFPFPYILQSMKTADMISCHSKVQTSKPFYPLTPMSDRDWISPYYFKPTSSKQVMRVKKDTN